MQGSPDANIQQRRVPFTANDQQTGTQGPSSTTTSTSIPTSLFTQSVASSVGAYVLTTGKERAQQALNIYSHIDYLRPYFDVEPKQVLNRLAYSLVPVHYQSNTVCFYFYSI